MKRENKFKQELTNELEEIYPENYHLVVDASLLPGFPDMVILGANGRWAAIETKKSENEPYQPNQEYYINDLNTKGYAAMMCPENKEEIMHDLERTFKTKR